jgi:hypothetical protein
MESNMLAELGATFEEVQRIYYFQPTQAPTDRDVYTIAEDLGCRLVIIDSAIGAYDASGLKDDGGRTDTERMGRLWVKVFFEWGVTTLLLDHVVKDAKARGRWAIGSERKLGKTDIAIGVDTITPISRGTNGLYKLIAGKDRGGYMKRFSTVAELHLSSDPETHRLTWEFRKPSATQAEAGGWKPTVLMQRVSEYLAAHPEGASRNEIEKNVKGKSNEHKRQAIDELLALGHASEEAGARSARIVKHLSSFTSPDLAPTSPGEVAHDLAHLARPSRGEAGGEVPGEVSPNDLAGANGHLQDEAERLAKKHADIAGNTA